MLFHRGFQDLGGQCVEGRIDLADQHNRPFNEACNLSQQTFIFDDFETEREGLVGGVVPDHLGTFVGAQHDVCAL